MATTSVTKSCLACPSFMNPSNAAAAVGKSANAPMCARFGTILGRPGATVQQNQATAQAIAKDCAHYGQPKPIRINWAQRELLPTEMWLPDPAARTELGVMDPARTVVTSCSQCKHLIEEDVVHTETGLSAGACAAKGRLIFGNKRAAEAKECEFRSTGIKRTTMDLPLLPIYSSVTLAEEARMSKLGVDVPIEPLEWISDREVTPEQEKDGIKAWRMVRDPNGSGNVAYLPVFRPDTFTPDQQELIPKTGDDEAPELYVDYGGYVYQIAVLWMELDETPAAWGMPGVGKTEAARHLAWLMQVPFYRFSIKESTELFELEGSMQYRTDEGGTYFREGRFVEAWRSISVIVVDEPNMGRPDVWAFLRPCLDNSRQLVIEADGGRRIARSDYCFPMLAMNPAWSSLNVGTNPIGAADASRLIHIDFVYPEEAVERKIIRNRVLRDGWKIDDARLDLVMATTALIRELCNQNALAMSWGIRETIKTSRLLRWFDPVNAFRLAAGNFLEPQQRDTLLDQVKANLPMTPFGPVEMIEEG